MCCVYDICRNYSVVLLGSAESGCKVDIAAFIQFFNFKSFDENFIATRKIPTTTIDEYGVESEKSINSLLQEPKIYELLGRDLTEELKFFTNEADGTKLQK